MLPKRTYEEEEFQCRFYVHKRRLANKSETELLALMEIAVMTKDDVWHKELKTAYLARSV